MKKKLLEKTLFLFVFTGYLSLHSQVASLYTFTQSFAPYIAITGGTVFGNTASDDIVYVNPSIPLGSNNGSSGPGIDIGFSFLYNNTRYDRIGIANDGWITFGKSSSGLNAVNTIAGNYYSIISASSSATADLQNRIAILSRDLQGQTGSELRVETIGSSPNRVCVIQWTNYRKYNATGDAFDFQLRLNETTNIIECIYGTFINGAVGGIAELGLRGTTNTDYSNRFTSAAISWSNSIAGTTNNSSVLFNNAGVGPLYGQSYKWTPPQCTGTLAALSASTNASFICPGGSSTITLLNSYTLSGITYTWSGATASSGPYTLVANTNSPFYAAGPVPSSTWFQAISTCLNGGSTVTSVPLYVQVAAPIISSIPYSEGFEGLIINDQLPNCSWVASNMPAICKTYTQSSSNNRIPFSGTKFAGFKSGTNANGDYFYTNGLQLYAGVTYSAAVAYITDGLAGWNNFSILLGPNQSSVNLTSIASINSINNSNYFQLSNTFTVATSGVYYLAIKCVGGSTAQYLSFDDIRVTAPCQLNSPQMSINANFTNICSGASVIIAATGADTYSWSTGSNSPSITVNPTFSTQYSVVGTKTSSSCSSTLTQNISVKNSPTVTVSASQTLVCSGSSVSLLAGGAATYTWNNFSNDSSIVVFPTQSFSYTVYGEIANGCGAFAYRFISVNPLPNITVVSTASDVLCVGQTATLTASGAVNYQWASTGLLLQSNPVYVFPSTSTIYTVTGTDANSCVNTYTFLQVVDLCSNIQTMAGSSHSTLLFPNPCTNDITVMLSSSSYTHWELYNQFGQKIVFGKVNGEKLNLKLDEFPNGCYNIKVLSDKEFESLKFIKN